MDRLIIISVLTFSFQLLKAEILIFKNYKNDNYTYEKNEYILDLNIGMMTREFIYNEDSFKKLRLNDLTLKKES